MASANSNSTSDILPIAPDAPTIGTATAISTTSASVTFTVSSKATMPVGTTTYKFTINALNATNSTVNVV
jgi:hypothetical protein